jgi:membrane-bound lytic murein transglycosylase
LSAFKRALTKQLANCRVPKTSTSCDGTRTTVNPTIQFGCRAYKRDEWCLQVNNRLNDILKEFGDVDHIAPDQEDAAYTKFMNRVKDEFEWYQSNGRTADSKDGLIKKGQVQFTAYYAPQAIEASRARTGDFAYPIYRSPPSDNTGNKMWTKYGRCDNENCGRDPVTGSAIKSCRKDDNGQFVPFWDRREINDGALIGKGLEIAYVKDPIDIYFLMIEGSGSLHVAGEPELVHVNYDSQNGRPRNMLATVIRCFNKCSLVNGRWQCQSGSPSDYASEQNIHDFLTRNPSVMMDLIGMDQSYVFYEEDKSHRGPMGAEDIPITANQSFATDRSVIPTGTLIWYHTKRRGNSSQCSDISALAHSQDSGGAINGAWHVDQYYGEGDQAKADASSVNFPGSLFVAVPKSSAKQQSGAAVPNCTESSVSN